MYQSEAHMKETILQNIEYFKSILESIFNEKEMEYIGEEIEMFTGNCDLLFKSFRRNPNNPIEFYNKYFVIELKNRKGLCKDLGQIARYINGAMAACDTLTPKESIDIKGVLICLGCSDELSHLLMSGVLNDDIKVLDLYPTFELHQADYALNDNVYNSCSSDIGIGKIICSGDAYDNT